MPVVLHKKDEEAWIEPDFVTPERLINLLRPYPVEEMDVYSVSREVNNKKIDSKGLIKPVSFPQQRSLI